MDKIKPEPGILIAPGYFMQFWHDSVQGKYTDKEVASNPFKPYRELLIAAPIAAFYNKHLKGKLEGTFYIEAPTDEPPDVNIVRVFSTQSPKGRPGYGYNRQQVEITRCDLDSGEDLFDQIQAKNTASYRDMSLAVHLTGKGLKINFTDIHARLKDLDIHLAEVLIVAKLVQAPDNKNTLFAVSIVYPELETSVLNIIDESAFTINPALLKMGNKAYNNILRPNSATLVPPF